MNTALTVVISIASAAAVVVGASLLDSDRVEASDSEVSAAVTELALRVEGLIDQQAALAASVAELERRPTATSDRRTVGEIEAAIERYLAEHAGGLEVAAQDVPALADPDSFASLDLQTILEVLGDDDRDWLEREELWQLLREEGRLDEVIAEFERLAQLDPNNPDRKVELGYAYIQKIQEVGASALAGKWATKADEMFDAALELDESHWTARYMKAISLSHWPAFMGKSAEAITQLETLIEVQDQSPIQDEHAEPYLTLGNMYLSQGKDDLALATWKKGLNLFPNHAGLKAQVAAVSHQ